MPNTYSTLGDLFTATANAIRAKTGSEASIVADNFPSEITAIDTLSINEIERYSYSETAYVSSSDSRSFSYKAYTHDIAEDGYKYAIFAAFIADAAGTVSSSLGVFPAGWAVVDGDNLDHLVEIHSQGGNTLSFTADVGGTGSYLELSTTLSSGTRTVRTSIYAFGIK